MSHHQPSHPMDIDTEKIRDDSIKVINTITKYHFDFNWKRFKAAVDALVHSQDIYAKAKDRADAELQNIQSAYYNIYYGTLKVNAQFYKESHPEVLKKAKRMTKCCAKAKNKCADTLAKIEEARIKLNDIYETLEEAVDMAEEDVMEDEVTYET